jgi:hypothetical protein
MTRIFEPNLGEYAFSCINGDDQTNFLVELMKWYDADYGYDGFRAHPVTKAT